MHKCINNSAANVYHLEQFVSDFFPYSQQQLGFDKPVIIRFESDKKNAATMLGKTAFYDPQNMEIALYVDNRHPKDVMRSLSHELVHHAQNCRGDFKAHSATEPGYAQRDPHLRKMEREAFTKGNLIFRDFEDLIKTGKIKVHIDFKRSGEPKMSLQEWKNNEINRKLMKKWGLLKEGKDSRGDELEEGWGWRDEDEDELEEGGASYRDDEDPTDGLDDERELPARGVVRRARSTTEPPPPGKRIEDPEHLLKTTTKVPAVKVREGSSRKISVREAKELTRRIMERVRKESK